MDSHSFYVEHSRVTDPGAMGGSIDDLPRDIARVQRIVRDLVLHYRADDPGVHGVPAERMAEVDTRYAEGMLRRLFELDQRPLTEERHPANRILGCCRDFTVLCLTMVRQHSIPARARVGFATYFVSGLRLDHEVAEVWDAHEARWRLVDAELGDEHVDPNDGVHVDPLDVPRDRFLVAGDAWLRCREGAVDPETFLVDPDLHETDTRGWPYLRHNLIHDLAALNKLEMLLWDEWGLIQQERASDADLELLDRIAHTTRSMDSQLDEVQRWYEADARLRVPRTVMSYSPASDGPVEVSINRT